jgi:hypothetical protein
MALYHKTTPFLMTFINFATNRKSFRKLLGEVLGQLLLFGLLATKIPPRYCLKRILYPDLDHFLNAIPFSCVLEGG